MGADLTQLRIKIPYVPNSPRHLAFHESTARHRLICGGVGSGKTYAGAWELVRQICECGPDLLHLVCAPSNRILKLATYPAVLQVCDQIASVTGHKIVKKCVNSDASRQVLFHNGAVAAFITLKNPEAVQGFNAAGLWIDEAASVEDSGAAFGYCNQRVRDPRAKKLYSIYTTSPKGPVGIIDLFRRKVASGDRDFFQVEVSTFDNPHLGLDYVRQQLACMSGRQVEQDVWGRVVSYEGTIYAAEFDSVRSMTATWRLGDTRKEEIYLAIDWGPNYPHCLFIAHNPDLKTDVVFDEVCEDGLEARAFLMRIKARLKERWGLDSRQVKGIYCDPNPKSAWVEIPNHFQGVSKFHRYGMEVLPGLDIVRGRLCDFKGDRRLKFFAGLLKDQKSPRRILQCMALYSWATRSTRAGVVQLDNPHKALYDHGPDALRYYCQQRYSGAWRREGAAG